MRLRLGFGLLVVLSLAAGLQYKLLLGLVGPDTLWTLIGIDAAALLLLLVYSIAALTAHLTALREMLSSLDIYMDGRHDHRLPVQGSGLLTDLSRRINDVLAHDAEADEMNSATPGIKRVIRPAEITDPNRRAALLSSPQTDSQDSVVIPGGEGVGRVRVRRRDSAPEIERFDTEVGAPDFAQRDDDKEAQPSHVSLAGNAFDSLAEDAPAPEADEVADKTDVAAADTSAQRDEDPADELGAKAKDKAQDASSAQQQDASLSDDEAGDKDSANHDSVSKDAPEQDRATQDQSADLPDSDLPDPGAQDDPRRRLHEEYLQAKKRVGESVAADLDFGDFNAKLDALRDQIIRERNCQDVRFELRVDDDSVALQPRIIRAKSRPPASG